MTMATRNLLIAVLAATAVGSLGWNLYRVTHQDAGAIPIPPRAPSSSAAGAQASGAQARMPTSGAPIGVRVGAVTEDTLASIVEAVGTVKANEAVNVTSVTAGLVTRVAFNEGSFVRAGETLVELDPTQARAALEEAQAALAQSRSQFERSKELAVTQAISAAHLQQLASDMARDEARVTAARGRLADTVIRAPFAGRLGLRQVSLGSLVSPGSLITTLDDIRTVKVDFAVPESVFPALHAGLPVAGSTVAYPGQEFNGEVASVDTRIDPVTRSASVRARFENSDGRLAPGMFLTLKLTSKPRTTLTVPERAVLSDQGKQYVYVVTDGVASRREVQLGDRVPGKAEILQGLTAADRIVVDGALKLREGSRIAELQDTQAETSVANHSSVTNPT
jgi:membrane fusion protein (multidrug efflux system)